MIAKNLFRCAGVLALLSSAQLSAAQSSQCLTEPEMRGLVAYALPSVTNAVIKRCGSRLASDGFLNTRGPKLVTELRAGQAAAWPMAKAAIVKIGGKGDASDDMFDSVPEEMFGALLDGMIEDKIGDSMKPQTCKDIDRVLGTMAPLPTQNMVEMVTQVAIIAARDSKEMPSCPAA